VARIAGGSWARAVSAGRAPGAARGRGESQRGGVDDRSTLIGSVVINHSHVDTCPHKHTRRGARQLVMDQPSKLITFIHPPSGRLIEQNVKYKSQRKGIT